MVERNFDEVLNILKVEIARIRNFKNVNNVKDKDVSHELGERNDFITQRKVYKSIPHKQIIHFCVKHNIDIKFVFYKKG